MQSIIDLFKDKDSEKPDKIISNIIDNSDNIQTTSLKQGSEFMNYQYKIQTNLEKNEENIITENFDTINSSSNLAKNSNDILNKTKISLQNQKTINDLQRQYNKTLVEYQLLLSKLSNSTSDYINRINPNNKYLNKNIKFTSGEMAYVTNQGIVKKLPQNMNADQQNFYNNSSGCPKLTNFISVNIPWKTDYDIPGTKIPTKPILLSGTPYAFNQSCGNEGSSIYVDQILNDKTSTYLGCYQDNQESRTMSFIGGEPKTININFVNGNFSQPSLSNNTFKYITSSSEVPGWNFNGAALVNNSDAWAFKKPYPYGNQCVVLQKTQSISQSAYLPLGNYIVTFSAIGRNCCDGSGLGNPIDVQINYSTYFKKITTVIPPVDKWQNYSFQFTIEQTPSNALTFAGTWSASDRSTAIQNIKIVNNGSNLVNGNYTYQTCKQSAIDSGYRYFALQSANPLTGKGYCAVSNDLIAPTSKGISMVVSGTIPLWSSNTVNKGAISAGLANNGSLSLYTSTGAVIFQTPNNIKVVPNYMGCYGDSGNRAMPQYVGDMTYDQCFQQAKTKNQKYFGLQYAINPPVAQCFLSNDIGSTTKYGLAGNCRNVNGTQYGMAWSNAVYNTSPDVNCFLILQDDGNMVIYRGSGPNDNQGVIWSSNTAGKKQKPDPKYTANKGKYGKNWVGIGATLAVGDFIGSNDGSTYLIMQNDGNLVLYTSTTDINCKKMNDGNMGGGINANALNKLNQVGDPSLIGKVAYVDQDSVLYNYSPNNIALSDLYIEMKDFDSAGNDIPSSSFGNATLNGCKTACNSNKQCYGFVFDKQNKVCYPKNKSMYPNSSKNSNPQTDLYMRKPMLINTPIGISGELSNVDSVKFKNYKKTDKIISGQFGLRNATALEKQQVENLKTRLDLISKQITDLSGTLHTNDLSVTGQSLTDTNSLFGLVNNTKKNIDSINIFNTNMDNILKDSDIALLYENYNYLFWSILATGTVIVSLNVMNKS